MSREHADAYASLTTHVLADCGDHPTQVTAVHAVVQCLTCATWPAHVMHVRG
jgi:hypothetical protein